MANGLEAQVEAVVNAFKETLRKPIKTPEKLKKFERVRAIARSRPTQVEPEAGDFFEKWADTFKQTIKEEIIKKEQTIKREEFGPFGLKEIMAKAPKTRREGQGAAERGPGAHRQIGDRAEEHGANDTPQ